MKKKIIEREENPAFALDINTSVAFRLIRIVNLAARSFPPDHTHELDISLLEWRVLAVIFCHPSITMTEISHYTGYGQMNVSRIVRQLIKKKFVVRTIDRFDRRRNTIELTETGASAHRKISKSAMKMEEDLLEDISEQDQRRLNNILNTMLEKLYSKLEK